MKQTVLERIVKERVGQSFVGTISVATDRFADEFAREAFADGTLRRTIRELARSCSEDLLKQLLRRSRSRRSTGARTRRKRASARQIRR